MPHVARPCGARSSASTAENSLETLRGCRRADMLSQLADVHRLAGAAAEAGGFYSLHSVAEAHSALGCCSLFIHTNTISALLQGTPASQQPADTRLPMACTLAALPCAQKPLEHSPAQDARLPNNAQGAGVLAYLCSLLNAGHMCACWAVLHGLRKPGSAGNPHAFAD